MIKDSGEIPTQCPYDSTHIVHSRGFGKHLIKCRQNHKGCKMVACKFDKTHQVPKPELPHHHSICPSRYLLDRELQLKAAAETVPGLSGDVIGPKIVSNYTTADDEDWDAEPNLGTAPVAYFNRQEMLFLKESNLNKTIPTTEKPCRKYPLTMSKAATISEMSSRGSQPNTGNQVYSLSFMQSMNAGWGRGKSVDQSQDPGSRDVVEPSEYDKKTGTSRTSALPTSTKHSSKIPVERYSLDDDNDEDEDEDDAQRHYITDMPPPFSNEHINKTSRDLQKGSKTSDAESCHRGVPSLHSYTDYLKEEEESSTLAQIQTNKELIRPAGRGIYRGFDHVRAPITTSIAQVVGGHLPVAKENKPSLKIEKPGQHTEHKDDDDFDLEDIESMKADKDKLKKKRKLGKKLKQIKVLEDKMLKGDKLTEEEKSKVNKKNEIESLVEKMSQLL